jgi:multiple sugar transport system permease protein
LYKVLPAVIFYIVSSLLLVFFIYPIFWTFLLSIKPQRIVFETPPVYLFNPDFSSWLKLGQKIAVGGSSTFIYKQLLNSVIISVGNMALSMFLGTPAAYAFTRYEFKGKNNLFFWFISYRMLPAAAVIVPIYLMALKLSLIDTYIGLILFYCTFNIPYVIWMLYGFFKAIPRQIDEAAMLDGCSAIQTLTRIILPLSKPGLTSTSFFCFIFAWNELLFAMILGGAKTQKLLVSAAEYVSFAPIHSLWPVIGAITIAYAAPCMVAAIVLRKYLIRGMALGAVKG